MSGLRARMPAARMAAVAVAAMLGGTTAAGAQSGRSATLPSASAPTRASDQWPTRVGGDGSVIVELARGYEYVVRPCAYYVELVRQRHQARLRAARMAPQGGSGQRPPGAAGLPQAPGLPALPGEAGRAAPATSGRSPSSTGSSHRAPAIPRVHASGLPYHNGICHVRDAYGRLRLIPL